MTPAEASRLLEEADLVPAMQIGLQDAKSLVATCLAEGIPATLGSDDHCTQGCAPRAILLVRQEDVERLRVILSRQWQTMLASVDGEVTPGRMAVEAAEGEEPACPACGTAAPLVEGACAECGLQLG